MKRARVHLHHVSMSGLPTEARRDPGWSPGPSWAGSKHFLTGQNPCGGAEGHQARCFHHGGSEPRAGSLPRPPSLRGSRSQIRAVPSPPSTGAPKGFSGRCWDRRDVVFGGFLHIPLHTSEGSWVQSLQGAALPRAGLVSPPIRMTHAMCYTGP